MVHLTYDLGLVASKLKRHGRFKPLVQAINDVLDIHSAIADLTHAKDAVEELLRLRTEMPSERVGYNAVTSALTSHIILLYARATKTTQKARKTFNLQPKMTEEQKGFHKQVCDLRDGFVAHFGTGKSYDGVNLIRETAYMKLSSDNVKFGVAVRRIMQDPELALKLETQVKGVLELYLVEAEEKQGTSVDKLMEFSGEAEVRAALEKSPFDAELFFGSPEEAADFHDHWGTGIRRSTPVVVPDKLKWLPERDD